MTTSGEMLAMNAMRTIYLRSLLLVLGVATLLVIEQLAAPSAGNHGAAPTAAVGDTHSPA
jgi:hypothetical protein